MGAFNLFDSNHNGAIDRNEMQTVLKTLGQNISQEETEDMMASVDLNNDGEIDFAEFVQMMENRMFLPSNTLEYQDAFKFFDKNGDGAIDFSELKDVLLSLGEDFAEQDIHDMIDEADLSGTGKVGFDEFILMMPANMQENYQKCLQREAKQSSANIVGTSNNNKGTNESEAEESASASVIEMKPTKR